MVEPFSQALSYWLGQNNLGTIQETRRVGGGCINNGMRLRTSTGQTFFLKTNSKAPADLFACEAEGLQALCVEDGPRVPNVFLCGEEFILLEDLAPGVHRFDYWQVFGRQLAALHRHTHPVFGFTRDNYIGSTPQPNPWIGDGWLFFAEQRLLFQARLAEHNGRLVSAQVHQVERLAQRLTELIPVQPASLIHGDLWSGNVIADERGSPAIIDPATHYGWAEAELAMTTLFGAFPAAFYQAYEEVRPLEHGYRQRFSIYNLYHLLNHLNLFGAGYLGDVLGILRRFG